MIAQMLSNVNPFFAFFLFRRFLFFGNLSALDLIDHHLDHFTPLGNVLAQLHLPAQSRHLCGQVINDFLGRLHSGAVVHSPQAVALFRALIRKSFETGSDILREVLQVLCRHDVIGGKELGFLAVLC